MASCKNSLSLLHLGILLAFATEHQEFPHHCMVSSDMTKQGCRPPVP